MTFRDSFFTALKGLHVNKSRSLLTILGIVIGITAIILVMSLGEGAQGLIIGQIEGMGSKTIVIVPGRQPKGPSDILQLFGDSLNDRDYEALRKKENVPDAEDIMPVVFGNVSGAHDNETYTFTLLGSTDIVTNIFNVSTADGSFFTTDDVSGKARVVVIGQRVKEELFGSSDAIGEKIKIKNGMFRIIGVLPKKGQFIFLNLDEVVMMPYTTAMEFVFGIKHFNRIIVSVASEDAIARTVADITSTLRETHGITDPEKDDFFLETQADAIQRVGVITNILTLLLVSIAAISLVVGGVGIMNIMLVSITERTREIGLRKALGATDNDILRQFLFEAVVLTGAGGVIGIILGVLCAFAAALVLARYVGLDWMFAFPISSVLLGLGMSVCVGLVFGIYPAWQASKKSPMEALRYE